MKALLWKDLRVNRPVLLTGAVLLLAPLLITSLYNLHVGSLAGHPAPWYVTWALGGVWSTVLSLLTVALLAGNAVAGERADRSAEFVAGLPISRRAIITSKAIVALGATIVIWAILLLIVFGLAPTRLSYGDVGCYRSAFEAAEAELLAQGRREILPFAALATVLIFGIAWFSSSFFASPVLAAGSGIAAPMVIGMIMATANRFGADLGNGVYALSCVIVGIVAFVAGTICFIRGKRGTA
jgi:hypothetical protein